TIERAKNSNSLTFNMVEKIIKICDALQWECESDVRFCVIEGDGDFFCSGIDLAEISKWVTLSKDEVFYEAMKEAKLLRQIASLPFPVLAKIKGGALNLGLGLVAVSDFAVSEENSIFGTPEIKIGVPPAMTNLYVSRKTNLSSSSLLSLTGEVIGAEEALSSGLIGKVFSKESFEEKCKKIEENFLENGPSALRKLKSVILKNFPVPQSEEEEYAATQLAEAAKSEEFFEGICAFKEKRIPLWMIKKE
ncbi:MAG: enoyl-CoA hydratase/isomerase family protein, partial [Acidobacteria bacterium]|nr:enoyl-CoA hydratase/isomerase family protein [Acidobacteriota bacterium]